jgi:4-nitrophenyl phosphatase
MGTDRNSSSIMTAKPAVFCDLDGVIWLAHEPIEGSVQAVARLRENGHRVMFVTNNSYATEAEQVAALESLGIPANGEVLTSAMACGRLLPPESRVLVCGGPGIVEAVHRYGATVLDHAYVDEYPDEVDVVVVGFHRHFDYEILRRAARAVRSGALFLATNQDPTYPTPEGEIPGGGSILAAIETAAGRAATVAGKPHHTMARALREMSGLFDDEVLISQAVMVGDRPSTDGTFAENLGCRFALVRSGVTPADWTPVSHSDHFGSCRRDFDVPDLLALAEYLVSS